MEEAFICRKLNFCSCSFFIFQVYSFKFDFAFNFFSSDKEIQTEEQNNEDLETDPTKPKSYLRLYSKKIIKEPEFSDVSAEELANNIKVQYVEGFITLEMMNEIYDNAADLCKQEFVKMVYKSRRGLLIFLFTCVIFSFRKKENIFR